LRVAVSILVTEDEDAGELSLLNMAILESVFEFIIPGPLSIEQTVPKCSFLYAQIKPLDWRPQ
jgi:hypothetical protein